MIPEYALSKQSQTVLNYLRNNEGMSTIDAWEISVLSPAKRIQELRNAGYKIETIYKRTDAGKRYGVYKLDKGGEEDVK